MRRVKRLREKILRQAETSQAISVLGSLLALAVIGYLDLISSYELGIALLYLFPIMLATWAGGRYVGMGLAVFGATLWLAADLFNGYPNRAMPSPYWNAIMRLGIFVIVTHLVFVARRSLLRERELSHSDPLTGSANRRAIGEILKSEIERSRRFKRPFSLAYIDINDFKKLNDRYGHKMGDVALQEICAVFVKSLRQVDTIGRLGGDEFAIILPECTASMARVAIGRCAEACGNLFHTRDWPIGLSIGIGTFNGDAVTVDEALSFVDQLMYRGKSSRDGQLQCANFRTADEVQAAEVM